MGRLRTRIKRLEQATSSLSDEALLEDGTIIRIAPGERYEALLALLDGEPHPLHDSLARLAPDQEDPSLFKVAALFKALKGENGYES